MLERIFRQIIWSRATFGPGRRTEGILLHMEKEIAEVRDSRGDTREWVDLVILALDGLWRSIMYAQGTTHPPQPGSVAESARQYLNSKQAKNEARIWPAWQSRTQDEPIEHERSQDL